MPIEIRELVIRTHIDEGTAPRSEMSPDELAKLKRSIVNECVSRVREQMQLDTSR